MGEIVQALNGLTPLGLAAGMAYIIYLQVKNRGKVNTLASNHLHELPQMAADLRDIKTLIQSQHEHIVHIRARVNGSK